MEKVFVYGTLKKHHPNHRLLQAGSAVFLGPHVTAPVFKMVSCGGYPGVLEGGSTTIHGEVYEVDEITMSRLDSLEGYPTYYNRKQIDTSHGKAWIYIINEDFRNNPEVPNGIW